MSPTAKQSFGLLVVLAVLALFPAFVGAQTAMSCVNLTHNMHLGSRDAATGGDVTQLQNFLIANGYLTGTSATGYFGAQTKAAVGQLQIARGIVSSPQDSAYGFVGPRTRGALVCSGSGALSATPASGPAPLMVNFTVSGSVTGASLDFGDGSAAVSNLCDGVSCAAPIPHTYQNPGSYLARLAGSAGVIGTAKIVVTTADRSAASVVIDPRSLMSYGITTLFGSARNTSTVSLTLLNPRTNQTVYSSGPVAVTNGTWIHTLASTPAPGTYLVKATGADTATVLASATLYVRSGAVPPPAPSTPPSAGGWNLSATPNPCQITQGSSSCTSTITWHVPADVITQLWVSAPGQPDTLFSCKGGPSDNSQQATWITALGDTFKLYQTNDCSESVAGKTPVATLSVTGAVTTTPPPSPAGAPTISSLSPASASPGTVVTITGTGFNTQTSGNNIFLSGIGLPVTSSADGMHLSFTVPAGFGSGAYSIVVRNRTTGLDSSPASFTITAPAPAPTITSVSPTSGAIGSSLTITGTNFDNYTTVRFLHGNSSGYGTITSRSATSLSLTVPRYNTIDANELGINTLTVQNLQGSASTLFTITSSGSGASVPTCSLSANGITGGTGGTPPTVYVGPGGSVNYSWSSSGATSAAGSWTNTNGQSSATWDLFARAPLGGSAGPYTYGGWEGTTFTLNYVVTNAAGSATCTIKLAVGSTAQAGSTQFAAVYAALQSALAQLSAVTGAY
jgi:hypothetical protein